jgi:membrane associated rhomboid family serine protease
MFEDRRDVCGRAPVKAFPSVTLLLVFLNVAAFIVQNLPGTGSSSAVGQSWELSLQGMKQGSLWELITFQFLHLPLADGGAFHLLGDVFVIYVFGGILEGALGRLRFLALYLAGGCVGGLFQMAALMVSTSDQNLGVVGASAGACALIAAFAVLLPRQSLSLFFVPFRFRPRSLLWVCIGVSLIGLMLPGPEVRIAHGAHLGGLLTGLLLGRWFAANRNAAAPEAAIPAQTLAANPVPE